MLFMDGRDKKIIFCYHKITRTILRNSTILCMRHMHEQLSEKKLCYLHDVIYCIITSLMFEIASSPASLS